MGGSELLGTHSYQLDAKGRISLPARFRERLEDGAFLTLGQDGCLWVFPQSEWGRISDEVHLASLGSALLRFNPRRSVLGGTRAAGGWG